MSKEESYERDEDIRDDLVLAAAQVGREELKNRFAGLDRPTKKMDIRKWWAAAAAVIMLIAAVFLMKPSSANALYAGHYSKLDNKAIPITRGDGGDKDLKIAMISYVKGEYKDALAQITKIEDEFPKVKIYKGTIAMEEGRYGDAVIILSPLSEDAAYEFTEDASWYLALAHIKLKNKPEATELLDKIIAGDSIYAKQALALKADL